ncbi:porin [Coraliomargarita sp. SDUM461003]|uniref:Porin n=1 Tax=Thalassobacterium maritimum TaxID=3041265 RepID=A0ABU1AS86_9BACT|nr:porin [Coraliomargarita sp. SDUM461003]MDQ8207027.1 porin [Coraliomargarita sp. SDUM461003]
MKNKIAIASAFVAASSFSTAEIVVNDFLSFEGFVDMSYTHTDSEFAGDEGNENSFAIDQVEISWLFDFDTVTAQIDFDYEDNDDSTTEVEQAFVTYHMDGGSAVTAGRYASMLGFEAFEPTGLYQYSFGYDMLIGDTSVLPGYAQGVKYTHESDTTFFGLSLQDEAYDNGSDAFGGNPDSTYAVEAAGSVILAEGLTGFLGGVYENGDDVDNYAINAYVTFETGAWIFAAEVNYGDLESGATLGAIGVETAIDNGFGTSANTFAANEEVLQFLLMANFAYSDQASITGRFTYTDHEADLDVAGTAVDLEADAMKFTLAHGYAFTDNLFLVTEVSYVDGEFDTDNAAFAGDDFDGLQGAVELIFSF